MPYRLPENVLTALNILQNGGFEAYAVGGCVRDMTRGVSPHDYDICTSALPAETKACFRDYRVIDTGAKHGTETVLIDGEPLEITTFRTDGDYLDGRHPQSVDFTRSLEEDLKRRDFTMNAMAYSPKTGVIDLYEGKRDIENRLIRCVGDAHTRLTEDALRILRALRFAAELDFKIDPETGAAMRDLKARLSLISRERVSAELLRMIKAESAPKVLRAYAEVVFAALPEAESGWQEGVDALEKLPAGDAALRLAALLHDADEIPQTLASLKLSKAFENQVLVLTAWAKQAFESKDAPLMLARLGEEQFERLLILQSACGTINTDTAQALKARAKQARDLPMTLRDLCVNGGDMMKLGLRGEAIGQTLNALHEAVLRGEMKHEKRELLARTIIGKTVTVTVDRPMHSRHPKHAELVYPVNYGYVQGVMAADGMEQDAYIIGVDAAIESFTGEVIAVIHRLNDVEDKWVVAPEGVHLSKAEIQALTHFQEQYFDTEII